MPQAGGSNLELASGASAYKTLGILKQHFPPEMIPERCPGIFPVHPPLSSFFPDSQPIAIIMQGARGESIESLVFHSWCVCLC